MRVYAQNILTQALPPSKECNTCTFVICCMRTHIFVLQCHCHPCKIRFCRKPFTAYVHSFLLFTFRVSRGSLDMLISWRSGKGNLSRGKVFYKHVKMQHNGCNELVQSLYFSRFIPMHPVCLVTFL